MRSKRDAPVDSIGCEVRGWAFVRLVARAARSRVRVCLRAHVVNVCMCVCRNCRMPHSPPRCSVFRPSSRSCSPAKLRYEREERYARMRVSCFIQCGYVQDEMTATAMRALQARGLTPQIMADIDSEELNKLISCVRAPFPSAASCACNQCDHVLSRAGGISQPENDVRFVLWSFAVSLYPSCLMSRSYRADTSRRLQRSC